MFKNLQLRRVDNLPTGTAMLVGAQVYAFHPCGSQQPVSTGFAAPRNVGPIHSVHGQLLLAVVTERRILPGSVVTEELTKRLADLESKQGFKPGRKQKAELKDLITQELLPRAFTRKVRTWVWIDQKRKLLAIDTSSVGRADDVLSLLHIAWPDLRLTPVNTEVAPANAMTDWLMAEDERQCLPLHNFTIDRDCELHSGGDDATVKFKNHPLDGCDITDYLTGGKRPTKLAMTWIDAISFVLTDCMEIKRLAYLSVFREAPIGETADEQFDADFLLAAGELGALVDDLIAALGGEVAPF